MQRGFTLIELVIALFLFNLGCLSFFHFDAKLAVFARKIVATNLNLMGFFQGFTAYQSITTTIKEDPQGFFRYRDQSVFQVCHQQDCTTYEKF